MNSAVTILSRYGALELKRAYRKNITIGVLTASAGFIIAIIAVTIITSSYMAEPEPVGTIVIKNAADLGAPPTLSNRDIPIRVTAPDRAAPSVGVPVPVPDEEAPDDLQVATQDDLAAMAMPEPVMDLDEMGNQDIVIENIDDLLPSPDVFVPYEEQPGIIENVKPVYPPMARMAGITGIVWVNALIDKTGKVRNVIIVRESGAQAGFEEAAVEAAYKTLWKPAISNGQPVAVWTTYRIIFEFK
jgi:protein TonB